MMDLHRLCLKWNLGVGVAYSLLLGQTWEQKLSYSPQSNLAPQAPLTSIEDDRALQDDDPHERVAKNMADWMQSLFQN